VDKHSDEHIHEEESLLDITSFGFEVEVDEEHEHEHEHIDAQVLLLEDPETGEEMEIALIDQIEDESGRLYWVCMELIPDEEEEDYHYGTTLFLRVDKDLGGEYEVSMIEGTELQRVQQMWDKMVREDEERHEHDLEDSGGRD